MLAGLIACRAQAPAPEPVVDLKLPLTQSSVRFAVIGDSGTGEKEQFQVGALMASYHARFPFDFVVMLGDNIYGSKTPADYKKKFEDPYKSLLDAGVKFYAALGNHDDPNQNLYKFFNMNGQRYYSFRKGNVSLFMRSTATTWILRSRPGSTRSYLRIRFDVEYLLLSPSVLHSREISWRLTWTCETRN